MFQPTAPTPVTPVNENNSFVILQQFLKPKQFHKLAVPLGQREPHPLVNFLSAGKVVT